MARGRGIQSRKTKKMWFSIRYTGITKF